MPARSVLVGFQVYRVLGFVFLVLWAVGKAPSVWALQAGVGDVLTGILAVPAAIYVQRRAPHWRVAGYALNAIGPADFAIALSILVTSPGLRYPLVMIPTFAVPLAIVMHCSFTVAASSHANNPGIRARPGLRITAGLPS
jgi:hypothetical protein